MNNIANWFKGKKVYLVSVFYAFFNVILVFKVITLTPDQLVAVNGFFIALFGAAFRSAMGDGNTPTAN